MKQLVADASVVIKWLFPDPEREPDVEPALSLLRAIGTGRVRLLQPPHWLAEVLAVCTRLNPGIANDAAVLLLSMEFSCTDTLEIYQRACALSDELDTHLFDTLYHAVALTTPDTTLITADSRYYRKAHRHGAIMPLRDFTHE